MIHVTAMIQKSKIDIGYRFLEIEYSNRPDALVAVTVSLSYGYRFLEIEYSNRPHTLVAVTVSLSYVFV